MPPKLTFITVKYSHEVQKAPATPVLLPGGADPSASPEKADAKNYLDTLSLGFIDI